MRRNRLQSSCSILMVALLSGGAALSPLGCSVYAEGRMPPGPSGPASDVGMASWYGHPYHGRLAASGEIYDMHRLTAAHRTLPFGTRVRVHNLANSKTVDVKINDRGPFIEGRLIDLSRAAALVLGIQRTGKARVRLEVLPASAATSAGNFVVQVGAFRVRANAERLQREMERRYGYAVLLPLRGDPVLWRVLTGRPASRDDAERLAQKIRSQGGSQAQAILSLAGTSM